MAVALLSASQSPLLWLDSISPGAEESLHMVSFSRRCSRVADANPKEEAIRSQRGKQAIYAAMERTPLR
jgi:hypothetical protein